MNLVYTWTPEHIMKKPQYHYRLTLFEHIMTMKMRPLKTWTKVEENKNKVWLFGQIFEHSLKKMNLKLWLDLEHISNNMWTNDEFCVQSLFILALSGSTKMTICIRPRFPSELVGKMGNRKTSLAFHMEFTHLDVPNESECVHCMHYIYIWKSAYTRFHPPRTCIFTEAKICDPGHAPSFTKTSVRFADGTPTHRHKSMYFDYHITRIESSIFLLAAEQASQGVMMHFLFLFSTSS